MGKLDSEEIIAPQLIRWRSFDGRQIPGFIYRPPAQFKGKRPVILYLHGGPTDQYRPRFNYEHNYYLKEMGVAWIYPNFRGSTGYGKDYLHSDNGLKREVAAKDVEALLMWIKAQPDLDSQRVMVHGASYGGYLALSVAYRIGSQVACVRVDAGFSNIATLIEKIDISRRELQRGEFGDERNAELRSYMNRIAPLSHASEIKSPVLIIHGVNDQVASIESVKDIASLIVQNNIPLWSIWAGKEGHDVSDYLSWNYQLYSGMVFAKWCLLEK
jgi:dipeptidyl aminopeptidase/acylaminoacyl peptidase